MSGADLGRDRGEPHRQVRKAHFAEDLLELAGEAAAADQPGAAEPEVEIAEHAPAGQLATPVLEGIELAGRIESRNDGPDRGSRDNVGTNTVGHQGAQHADMREPPGGAATQHKADREPILRIRSWTGEFAG